MLIRVQFIDGSDSSVVQIWSLFIVPESETLSDTFRGIILEKYTCGRKLDFTKFDLGEVVVSVATSGKLPSSNELMPAPQTHRLHELKEMNTSLYIQYDLRTKRIEGGDAETTTADAEKFDKPSPKQPSNSITNALMNRQNSYVTP